MSNSEIPKLFQRRIDVEQFETEIRHLQDRRKQLNARVTGSSKEISDEMVTGCNLRTKIMQFEQNQQICVDVLREEQLSWKSRLDQLILKRECQNRERILNGELVHGDTPDTRWDIDTVDGTADEDEYCQLSREIAELESYGNEWHKNLLYYEETMYWMLKTAMQNFVSEAKLSSGEASLWGIFNDAARTGPLFKDLKENLEVMKDNTIRWMHRERTRNSKEGNFYEKKEKVEESESLFHQSPIQTSKLSWDYEMGSSDSEIYTEVQTGSNLTFMESPTKEIITKEADSLMAWKSLVPTPTFGYAGIPWDPKQCFKCGKDGHDEVQCSQNLQTLSISPIEKLSAKHDERSHENNHEDLRFMSKNIKICHYCAEIGHVKPFCWYLYPEKKRQFHETKCLSCNRYGHTDDTCHLKYPHLRTLRHQTSGCGEISTQTT